MTIEVYPSTLPGEPIETYEWSGTIGAWFDHVKIDYRAWDNQPVVAIKGGMTVPVSDWDHTLADSVVEIRVVANGDPITWAVVAALVLSAASFFLRPGVRGTNRDTTQGARLDVASASANQARLGEVVPELAGRFKRFPDYLTPPRRHFLNGPREQWIEFLTCIGPGEYSVEDVKIGDTPFSGLGPDGSYGIYPPGADLSSVTAAQHWHTVSEVGGTSTGTAGLELGVDMQTTVHDPAPSYQFSGVTIAIPSGYSQTFPAGWGPGTVVEIDINRPGTYTASLVLYKSRFSGDFGNILPLTDGTVVNVEGAGLSGDYEVYNATLDGAGVGSLELWTIGIPPTDEDPIGVPSEQIVVLEGDYTMTFRRPVTVTLGGVGPDFLTLSGYSFPAFEAPASITYVGGNAYGAFTSLFGATPGNETTTVLELDFFFSSGLAQILDSGGLAARTVTVEVQYRDKDVGGAFSSQTFTYTQATLDQIGFTQGISFAAMRPEVRVRRTAPTSTSTQIQDKVAFYGLRSLLPARSSYPNWTTMAVYVRSGNRIGAQSESQINVIATRKLPRLQAGGTWSAPVATRDISAFARYIATTIGYTDANLSLDELERLHDIWVARGETLDYVFEETTVKEALDTSFNAGMAELTIDDGLIKPVRDDVRTSFEQGYSLQNITGPLKRSFRTRRVDDHDGVEVEYIDGLTFTKETVVCLLPGDNGFKLRKVKLNGVTDRTRAWRIGMRIRREMRYRRWTYGLETELDALNSGYLSYVPLVDDIPGYGQSAILHSITASGGDALIRVSEPLVWTEGESHVVAYRRPDGTVAGPFAAAPGPDDYSVIADVPTPWPVISLSQEPPHVYFGTTERWAFPALITDISPGDGRVSVTAVNYDPRVYADDNNAPA